MTRQPRWAFLNLVDTGVQAGVFAPTTQHVAYVLALRYGNGTRSTIPVSQATLADATGLARSTVQRGLHELEGQGLLAVERRHRQSNVYRFGGREDA